jgi:hypothetical protein
MNIDFNPDMDKCPKDVPVYLMINNGYIFTGIKTVETAYRYPGTKAEQKLEYIDYTPVGVGATYCKEVYFYNTIFLGWSKLIEI